ncbi:unnamed protein product [Boreogadus saida]
MANNIQHHFKKVCHDKRSQTCTTTHRTSKRYGTILRAGYGTILRAGYGTILRAGYGTILRAGYGTILRAGYGTILRAGYGTILRAGQFKHGTQVYSSSEGDLLSTEPLPQDMCSSRQQGTSTIPHKTQAGYSEQPSANEKHDPEEATLPEMTMCQHANLSPDKRPRGGGDRGSPPSQDLRPLGRPATATGDEAHTDTHTCWAGQHGQTRTVEWLSAGIHAVCTWCNMN